jgi:modulator of FtsH protease
VNAYDVAAWSDFAQTVGGGAAALAGLLFVGLSMNLTEVLTYPALPARAAATLALLIAIVLVTLFLATPGQTAQAVGLEIGAVGVLMTAGAVVAALRQRGGRGSSKTLYSLALLGIPTALLIVGGISLWFERGGGLYWITASAATSLVASTANAWVLLVEIKR